MTASETLSISTNKNLTNSAFNNDGNDIVTFNIGGTIYSTRRSTINDNVDAQAFLSLIIKNQTKIQLNNNGQYFIDRDGKYFSYIINYFREKKLILPDNFHDLNQLLSEAKFYQIDQLVNEIENYLNKVNEKTKDSQKGFYFTLVSTLDQNRTILKINGPLNLINFFHIQMIGEQFLSIISTFNRPENIRCQLLFPFNERLISCQPFDQLQRFVLAKQARKMGLAVSYCDDYLYIPTKTDIMTRDEFAQVLLNKYGGRLLNSTVEYDDSCNLVEQWFLPIQSEEIYSNASTTSVQ